MQASNGLQFPLTEIKVVANKWFYMEDDSIIDVIVGTYIANRFNADPLWMILIAPPSNTKTELLRAFEEHWTAYFLSNLTPSTLVSGVKPKKGQSEPSLLPRLNNKLLILKDFTTILSMRSEARTEIVAQFREIYDGQYTKAFGNGKEINWKGKIGLIAACTPVYDNHHGVIGAMGERFLLYRSDNLNGAKMGLQAQKIVGQEDQMRIELQSAFHTFIDQFETINSMNFKKDDEINTMIVALDCFVAYARCPVERDRYNQCVLYDPLPEGTARLTKQFMQIGMGLALAHGKDVIDADVYLIIKKIGKDLITAQRLRILKHLWDSQAVEHLDGWNKTKEVSEGINMPTTTARILLEDLMVVGALKRNLLEDGEKSPYGWQLTTELCEWIGGAEIFRDPITDNIQ